ncbi:MAG: hypothetical protein Q8Q30_02670 [Candidatus Woesebacteria bacterium]|nr:hypothetical protein [Candidatus Woesebacteria bacterium]
MKEIIGNEGLSKGEIINLLNGNKYVRLDERIITKTNNDSPFTSHYDLAVSLGVNEFKRDSMGNKLAIVDDAGIFDLVDGKIVPSGLTTTCMIKDSKMPKDITIKILLQIYGEDVIWHRKN